jgi:hypothetical protein
MSHLVEQMNITYQCDKPGLQAQYGHNVLDIPSDPPHKSRNNTGDRECQALDHLDLWFVGAFSARPIGKKVKFNNVDSTGNFAQKMPPYHCLRIFDMDHTQAFNLFRRQETKLNLLNRAQRRLGVGEVNVRHGGGL